MASTNPKETSSSTIQTNVVPATSTPFGPTHPVSPFNSYKMRGGFSVDSGWLTIEQFNEAVASKRPDEPYQEAVLRYEAEHGIPYSKVALSKAELATLQAASKGNIENINDMFSKFISNHVAFLEDEECKDMEVVAEELKGKKLTREQLVGIGQRIVEGFSKYEKLIWEAGEKSAWLRSWGEKHGKFQAKKHFQVWHSGNRDFFEDTRCITRDLDVIRAWVKSREA